MVCVAAVEVVPFLSCEGLPPGDATPGGIGLADIPFGGCEAAAGLWLLDALADIPFGGSEAAAGLWSIVLLLLRPLSCGFTLPY